MTTPEPRVRVVRDPWAVDVAAWCANCPYCGIVAKHRWGWQSAMYDAADHLQEPCAGMRLARLLREVEELRDKLRDDCQSNAERAADSREHGSWLAASWCDGAGYVCKAAAADLAAILARAAGGTG